MTHAMKHKTRKTIALLLMTSLLAACQTTRTHYGYTEAQWQAMNDEQKAKAKADFDELVASRNEAKRREQMEKDLQSTIAIGRGTGRQ